MKTVRRVARGTFMIGEPIVLGLAMRGHVTKITVRVTESSTHRVRWRGGSLGITGDHSFTVEAAESGARFTSHETFTGLPLLLVPQRILGEVQEQTLAGMQRFAALFR